MGQPVFEMVDLINPAGFFVEYKDFESVTLPDFTGEWVRAYLNLQDTDSRLEHITRAFPSANEVDDYFDQYPTAFNRRKLKAFQKHLHSKVSRLLLRKSKSVQEISVSNEGFPIHQGGRDHGHIQQEGTGRLYIWQRLI